MAFLHKSSVFCQSSLLMALLGELYAESGTVSTVGKVAYVSQEAWIFNGSLKNNITFGQELDEAKYKRVIEICALQRVSVFHYTFLFNV